MRRRFFEEVTQSSSAALQCDGKQREWSTREANTATCPNPSFFARCGFGYTFHWRKASFKRGQAHPRQKKKHRRAASRASLLKESASSLGSSEVSRNARTRDALSVSERGHGVAIFNCNTQEHVQMRHILKPLQIEVYACIGNASSPPELGVGRASTSARRYMQKTDNAGFK